jgi:hypothetical protein
LNALLGPLSEAFDALLRALSEAFDALLRALSDAFDALLRALSDARHAPSGSLAHVANRAPGSPAGALDDVAGIAEQVVSSAAHIAERVTDALEQFRIAIEGREDASENLCDLPQADFQQRLSLDVLDIEFDLAEPNRGTGVQLDEVPGLGEQGEVSPEVVQFELDLFDLDDRRVDKDVYCLFDLFGIDGREVGHVLFGALSVRR